MSASLVGSEMCIRDRSSASASSSFGSSRPPSSPSPVSSSFRLSSAPLSPVSYTHLTLPTICSV
eukprot:15145598-Alexandrium_andersonii.AAC.1